MWQKKLEAITVELLSLDIVFVLNTWVVNQWLENIWHVRWPAFEVYLINLTTMVIKYIFLPDRNRGHHRVIGYTNLSTIGMISRFSNEWIYHLPQYHHNMYSQFSAAAIFTYVTLWVVPHFSANFYFPLFSNLIHLDKFQHFTNPERQKTLKWGHLRVKLPLPQSLSSREL